MIGLALVTLVATLAAGHHRHVQQRRRRPRSPASSTRSRRRTTSRRFRSARERRGEDARVSSRSRACAPATRSSSASTEDAHGRRPDDRQGHQRSTGRRARRRSSRSSARDGAFVDDGFAKNHDLAAGSPFLLLTPTGKTLDLTVKGIFKPPAGGSPFGPVTISSATFDANYTQPKNIFTFVTMKGGVTDANTKALNASARGIPERQGRGRRPVQEESGRRASRASSTSCTCCSRSRCS